MMVAGAGTLASAPLGACPTVSSSSSATMAVNLSDPPSPQDTSNASSAGSDVGPSRIRTSENRRSNKPIMEKRRRARINNCLNELKTLILDAMKKDPARHSKLEKADILEMTVKHLESLQRQQVAIATASDPSVANKYRAGFTECAGEVSRFPGLDGPVKGRLLQHLSNCLNNSSQKPPTTAPAQTTTTDVQQTTTPVQVHILRSPDSSIIQGLQLVPTRLPNGDIALILPAARTTTVPSPTSPSPSVSSSSSGPSPLPMLIPIPNRSTQTSPSPVAFDRLSVSSPQRQLTIVTSPPTHHPVVHSPPEYAQPPQDDMGGRLLKSEEYEEPQHHYDSDRETMLHIPEREYYEDSYDDDDSKYYQQRPYSPEDMPKPLALVTRKRCEEIEEEHWRPW